MRNYERSKTLVSHPARVDIRVDELAHGLGEVDRSEHRAGKRLGNLVGAGLIVDDCEDRRRV